MQITICGGGNAAHTLAGLLGAAGAAAVNVYVPLKNEERLWSGGLSKNGRSNGQGKNGRSGASAGGGITVHLPDRSVTGRPARVSSNPAEVVPGSEVALLALPAFAHDRILRDIAPYLDEGAWLGALPARGGFDWSVFANLGPDHEAITVFGLQTLPWACRIEEFGRSVRVLGVKDRVELAAQPAEMAGQVAALLEDLLGLAIEPVECFLCLTLANTGQLLHPGLMYGLFKDWDGRPYPEAPLFYQGAGPDSAALLEDMSAEIMAIRSALEPGFPCLDFSLVRPLVEWLRRSYPGDIGDPASLHSCLATNRSYRGLKAPMQAVEGGLIPDFRARYLVEDIPYGLVVSRGIAGLAGLETPTIDRVILWAQERLGMEFLKDGRLAGKDLPASRAPQRYGITTLEMLDQPPAPTLQQLEEFSR
jgi:hypothetical protein